MISRSEFEPHVGHRLFEKLKKNLIKLNLNLTAEKVIYEVKY